MALTKQNIPINFIKGLDTKTDPNQIQLGKFLSIKNSIFDELGSWKKRNGYTPLPATILSLGTYSFKAFASAVTLGCFTASYRGELVMGDGKNFFSYSQSDQVWAYKGRIENCSTSLTSIYQDQYNNLTSDSAVNLATGFSLYAWESWSFNPRYNGTYLGLGFSLKDEGTGQSVLTRQLSSTRSLPKCVAVGSFLYLLFFDSGSNSLIGLPISSSGAGTGVVLANDIAPAFPVYDVMVSGSTVILGYNGTGSTVKVKTFSSALVLVDSASKSETATNGLGVFTDLSGNIWAAYNNGSDTKAFVLDSTLATTVLAPTVVDSGGTAINVQNVTGVFDGTQAIILYDQPGLPVVGQYPGVFTGSGFTQPAVGATVNDTSVSGSPSKLNRQLIFVETGGYYYVDGTNDDLTLASLVNLGYPGNASPGASITASSKFYPAYGYSDAVVTYNTLTVAGAAGTPANWLRSVALSSRAFLKDGVAHAIVCHDAELQPTYFLSSLYNISGVFPVSYANITAKIFPSEAGGIPRTSILPNIQLNVAAEYVVTLPRRTIVLERTSNDIPNTFFLNGIYSSEINLSPQKISTKELGNVLNIASGVITEYDGQSVVELGFHLFPENVTAVWDAAGGTGSLSTGLYGYSGVYQWIDAQGQINRSAPSPLVSVSATADNGQNTVKIPTLRLTAKQNVTLAIYRTAANGSTLFRTDIQYNTYPINNSQVDDYITFVDFTADVNIEGNEQIYTTGEVENISPPASDILGTYKNRLALVPSEDPIGFEYSKQVLEGSPVEFSDLFFQNIGTVGGSVTGITNLDDKIILFKDASIYYMTGTGPSPSGANSDFSEPIFITADCGLIDATSAVTMPRGVMFKSAKGIYLLDRSLGVSYIGDDVESYNQYMVLSAQLIPLQNEVRFLLEGGFVLVYDYLVGQWITFETINGVSDTIFQKQHTYLDPSGVVHMQQKGVYSDGANPVNRSFTTGWINVAGLQGFERAYVFYFLAKYLSPHTLSFGIAYDYDPTILQVTDISPDPTETVEQWQVYLERQKCEAFQITLLEDSDGTGGGFNMSGVDLTIGVKDGKPRLKASRSVG